MQQCTHFLFLANFLQTPPLSIFPFLKQSPSLLLWYYSEGEADDPSKLNYNSRKSRASVEGGGIVFPAKANEGRNALMGFENDSSFGRGFRSTSPFACEWFGQLAISGFSRFCNCELAVSQNVYEYPIPLSMGKDRLSHPTMCLLCSPSSIRSTFQLLPLFPICFQ